MLNKDKDLEEILGYIMETTKLQYEVLLKEYINRFGEEVLTPKVLKGIRPPIINGSIDTDREYEYGGEVFNLQIGDSSIPTKMNATPVIIKFRGKEYYVGEYNEIFKDAPWDLCSRVPKKFRKVK